MCGLHFKTADKYFRTELLNLGSDSEFLAKLFGVRKALSVILGNVSNKDFLNEEGKNLVSDFLLCCNQTPSNFQTAFDEIVRFCGDDDNWPLIEDELGNRGVSCCLISSSPSSSLINVLFALENRQLIQEFLKQHFYVVH